jgi:hypothetical protein
MLPRGGRAAGNMTRGGGAEGVAQGKLEVDDTRGGRGWKMQGKRAADDKKTQQEGVAHDVVGIGNGGGDSGGGSWSSEIGGGATSNQQCRERQRQQRRPLLGELMMPTTCQCQLAVAEEESNDGNSRAATNQAGWRVTTG